MRWIFLCIVPFLLLAQEEQQPPPPVEKEQISPEEKPQPVEKKEHVSAEEIQQQLNEAEAQFNHALELFNPWYTGPLLTSSATMVPPGHAVVQPYIYFTDNYGKFNSDRKRIDAPNRFIINFQPLVFSVGVTPSVDTSIAMGALAQWQQDKSAIGFEDISTKVGFSIYQQSLYVPGFKFSVGQTFPTGKYQHLDPDKLGLDGVGAGAWQTSFTFSYSKLFFWDTLHPFNTRAALIYGVSTPIHVKGFNSYGGGYGCHGTVHPGNSFQADVGMELSINQPWVIALDIVYNFANRTTFNGFPGTTTKHGSTPASVGGPYNDQLSLAPAVEYNWSGNMGMLGGVWFTVYGKNAANFVSAVLSWYLFFPP